MGANVAIIVIVFTEHKQIRQSCQIKTLDIQMWQTLCVPGWWGAEQMMLVCQSVTHLKVISSYPTNLRTDDNMVNG